jgi:hypothetical protein
VTDLAAQEAQSPPPPPSTTTMPVPQPAPQVDKSSVSAQSEKPPVKSSPPAEQIPTVNFCELTQHPKDYINKVVRVQANYTGLEDKVLPVGDQPRLLMSYLYDDSCNDNKHKIHDDLNCQGDSNCRELRNAFNRALAPYLRPKGDRFGDVIAYRVNAVFIGYLMGLISATSFGYQRLRKRR